ncbi:hypothetical protein [Nostoc sp. CHAB 5715]|uniref:hypothetical protein n=1 Tax=Nostoc sp. CHAB 5715 TaxID=2780400 RepID=UPI001E4313E5|nr:hypothetical protein [Nostoc sp. CHAB 5715]MCC5620402.1 hypothetical protein [Nostoc sp. CHAB 5715]
MAVIVRSLPQKTFAKGNFIYTYLPNKIANAIVGNRFWQAFHLDLLHVNLDEIKVIPLTKNSYRTYAKIAQKLNLSNRQDAKNAKNS